MSSSYESPTNIISRCADHDARSHRNWFVYWTIAGLAVITIVIWIFWIFTPPGKIVLTIIVTIVLTILGVVLVYYSRQHSNKWN